MSLLVLGGARSGKSTWAQAQAEGTGLEPVFLATAEAFDDEMRERIERHVGARADRWVTREEPHDLPEALGALASPGRILLVDCLTLWLGNLLLRGDDLDIATASLAARVRTLAGPAILVSNEVGAGIVPDNPLARRFRDAQGLLNQEIARACTGVVLVTAGLPRQLKPAPAPSFRFAP